MYKLLSWLAFTGLKVTDFLFKLFQSRPAEDLKQRGISKANLDKYEILDEIPLNTSGGFMKTDILLIKRNITDPSIIDDAIIIENKLSSLSS